MRKLWLTLLMLGAWSATVPAGATACTIPVFRYALEAWRPDNYEVILFHRGALSDAENGLLQPFQIPDGEGVAAPNTALVTVDLDGDVKPDFAEIWEEAPGGTLPWLMVRTPFKGSNDSIWSGPLSKEAVDAALVSPLRNEIARRIIAGDSVVWVLLEGTDAPQNDAIASMVNEELTKLALKIALPEIDPRDLASLSVSPEQLRLKFSLLRLNRIAEADRLLAEMLLSVEADLRDAEFAESPMLFPVFGRGRVYYPLVGAGIVAENVENLARFLCGACQCTIKAQNPGLDLLLAVDWDRELSLTGQPAPMPPGLTGLDGFHNSPPQPLIPGEANMTATSEPVHLATRTGVDHPQESESDVEKSLPPSPSTTAVPSTVDGTDPRAVRGGMGQDILFVAGLLTVIVVILSVMLLPRQSR